MISDFSRGIICIIGGFLIHFSLGTVYTFGNMVPYVVSYLRTRTSSTWVTPGDMVWIFSMVVFWQGLTMALGGVIEKKIGARWTCLIGCWTMSISTMLTAWSVKTNFWVVLLTYGILFGVGTGITYSVAISAAMKWFPLHKGFVTGGVVAGYGLGSLLFNIAQTQFINPNNVAPNSTTLNTYQEKYFNDKSVLDRVPICFLVLGCSYAAIQLLGVIFLMNFDCRPTSGEEQNLMQNTAEHEENYSSNSAFDTADSTDTLEHGVEYTVREAVQTKPFWIFWFTFFFNGISIVMISSLYKTFGQQFISNDKYIAIVGSLAAIFNSGGRLAWGRSLDRFSYRLMMTVMTISMAVMMGSFYLCNMVKSAVGAQVMYLIWVCLLFFCLSGSFAIFPTATAQTFGNKNMSIIYGMVFSGYAISSICGALICSLLLEFIHYGGEFTLATIAALFSLCLTQFFGPFRVNPTTKKE